MENKDLPKHESKKLNRFNNTRMYRELGLARVKARSVQFDWKKCESSH